MYPTFVVLLAAAFRGRKIGFWLLDEAITAIQIAGALLVLGGVLAISLGSNSAKMGESPRQIPSRRSQQ